MYTINRLDFDVAEQGCIIASGASYCVRIKHIYSGTHAGTCLHRLLWYHVALITVVPCGLDYLRTTAALSLQGAFCGTYLPYNSSCVRVFCSQASHLAVGTSKKVVWHGEC